MIYVSHMPSLSSTTGAGSSSVTSTFLDSSQVIVDSFSIVHNLILGDDENSRFIVEFPSYFPSWIGSLSIVTLNAAALLLTGV